MRFPANTIGQAAQAAAPGQEAVMGQAIPRQHPAVVLRSHFNQLRALLAIALVAVVGLTVAVVILANDNDEAASTSAVAVPASQAGSGTVAKHEAATAAAIGQPNPSSATETKDEAASAAAIGQSSDDTVTRGSKTDPNGPASLLR